MDDDVSQGRIQPFETEFWDGKIPAEPEFELVDKPREEWIDKQELIARKPPEQLTTDGPEGNGRYLLTYKPRWVESEAGFDWPPNSFMRSDVEGYHVFLNLGTLN